MLRRQSKHDRQVSLSLPVSVDSSYKGSCPIPFLASIAFGSGVLCSHSLMIATQPVDLFTDTTLIYFCILLIIC